MFPDLGPAALRHAEGPAAAQHIATVLPDGAEPPLEQVNALTHLDAVYGGVVVVPPKVLHALDLLPELFQLCLVFTTPCSSCSSSLLLLLLLLLALGWLAVEPHSPDVLRGKRPHGAEEVLFGIAALLGWGGDGTERGVGVRSLRQP